MNHTDEAVRDGASVLLDAIAEDGERWFDNLGIMTDATRLVEVVAQGARERSLGLHPQLTEALEALDDRAVVRAQVNRYQMLAMSFVLASLIVAVQPHNLVTLIAFVVGCVAALAYTPWQWRIDRWYRDQKRARAEVLASEPTDG